MTMDIDDAMLRRSPQLSDCIGLVIPLSQHHSERAADRVTILHVDDQPDFASTAKVYLEQANDDFAVITETSVAAGIAQLDERSFDCVVSDFQMPGEDGLVFLDQVRDRNQNLPFILFTGKGSKEVASEAISRGATDYLQKGTGTSQYDVLASRVRKAVDRYYTNQEL